MRKARRLGICILTTLALAATAVSSALATPLTFKFDGVAVSPGTIEGGLSVPFVVNHESCSRIEKVNLLSNGQAKDHVLADLPPLSCIGLVQPPFERWSGGSAKEFVFTSGGKATVTLATPLTFETESPPDFCIWESKEKISGGYEAGVARAVGQMLMKLNHHRSSASCAPGTTKTPFALELTRESSVLEAEKG